MIPQDKDTLPLYGSVTGILLSEESISIALGVTLRRGLFDTFSTPMMGFKEAQKGSHTPAPWVAVDGAYHSFKSRTELAIEDISTFDGFTPSQAMWLVVALLRLRLDAPVRVTAVANVPLKSLQDRTDIWPLSFEASPHQNGLFRTDQLEMTSDDLDWLSGKLPIAVRLFQEERFMRALTVFDESVWSSRLEIGTVLIWTAIEILFDCGGAQHKTKAICSALAAHVSRDSPDRDRAYNVIRDLYEKRGGIVHGGRSIEGNDFGQSHQLARAAFMNILDRNELPGSQDLLY